MLKTAEILKVEQKWSKMQPSKEVYPTTVSRPSPSHSESGEDVDDDFSVNSEQEEEMASLKKASSVVPKDTFSSPVCLIVLDAAVTWKSEIRTYFAAWWIYIPPTLAFTLRFLCSSRSLFHSDWYCQGLCRMRSERVITVMASVDEFASGRPKRRRACGVATSGTSIVVVELPLATTPY